MEQKLKRKNETVFVTMSFSDKMKKARKQISEANSECGFIPVLIDIKEHNNQIVPEIYKEIESCTFGNCRFVRTIEVVYIMKLAMLLVKINK